MTPAGLHCLHCGAEIPLDDVNVATDLALCRACGKTMAFSMISGANAISPENLSTPPRSVRVADSFGNETQITYHRLSPILLFLVPFTLFWSGGSIGGIYGTQIAKGHFEMGQSLFGVPFLVGTVILLGVIIFLAFGKWIITLDRGMGTVYLGVGPFGYTRRFNYNSDTTVALAPSSTTQNGRPLLAICVRTDETNFLFGAMIKDDAKRYIAALIVREAAKGLVKCQGPVKC